MSGCSLFQSRSSDQDTVVINQPVVDSDDDNNEVVVDKDIPSDDELLTDLDVEQQSGDVDEFDPEEFDDPEINELLDLLEELIEEE